jgi:hypothetical protein
VNLERRGLKKGQKAMALAMLFPEQKVYRGKKSESAKLLETESISGARLSQARSVLRHSLALAQDVIHDRVPLDAALARVKDEQTSASGRGSRG